MSKSLEIKNSLREGFKNGTSKVANRVCYGYSKSPNGSLIINEDEAAVIRWIFKRYLAGDSLGKITNGLANRDIPSPTGKERWSWEAVHKLLSNEKYVGKVLLQKTVSMYGRQFVNNDLADKVLYSNNHPDIISEKIFNAVQAEKLSRSKQPVMERDFNM